MKFFNNWFAKKVKWAIAHMQEERDSDMRADIAVPHKIRASRGLKLETGHQHELQSRGVNFQLYTATGGTVVELRSYDERTDRHVNALHVIPSDADLGEALSKIITYEALKR